MQQAGKPFRQAFDTWIPDAVTWRRTAEERLHFFRETIRPAAAEYRESIGQNKLLSRKRIADEGKTMREVWAGEMPLQTVWDFYAATNSIGEETKQKLEMPEAKARGGLRVPVIIIGSCKSGNPKAEEDDAVANSADAPPVSVRKRILPD